MNTSQLRRSSGMSSDPVAILAERAGIPHRRIHRQADKPAEQQVVIQLLNQLPFRADRVERLRQQRPQQLFGRDARAAREPRSSHS
jgi:hypothetical protein